MDKVESFAEFLYRRRFGLGESDPLPDKDDSVWKAFRRQAKDILTFTSLQEAEETEAERWKRRFLAAVEDNQELLDENFALKQRVDELEDDEHGSLRNRIAVLEENNRRLQNKEYVEQVNAQHARQLREWLDRPSGSCILTGTRVTIDAVMGGGLLVRVRPYKYGEN